MNTRPDFRRRPLIEELEPRLLYSADLALALPDGPSIAVEQRLLGADGEFAGQAGEQKSARLEVVFIDTRVDNYQQLLNDIREQNSGNRAIEVVLIDSQVDGLAQVGDFLALQRNVDAIHLISHGSDGSIQLGSSPLDLDTLLHDAGQIQAWGNALSPDADILLYGCDVAAGTAGRAFVDRLAQLTGADVAASIDLSGSASRGGDWQLEYRDGTIETPLAFDATGQYSWSGTLAAPTLDLDANDSSGTIGANYTATNPVTPGPVAITDIDARLTDSDSTNLSSLTVSIGNLLNGTDESLAAVTTGTSITASYVGGTGVLTLSGTDSVAHYQQVLRTVTYQNAASAPDRTARTITFEASDGSATSNLGIATVNWTYALHQFNASSYSENDGTINWNGAWTEFNDGATDPSSGRVTVSGGVLDRAIPLLGDSTLRGVQFGIALSNATHAELSFDYRLSGASLIGNSTIQVDVSGDGTSWTTVFSISPGSTLWSASPAIDLAPYASATTQIRLLSSSTAVLSVAASIQFDDIEVSFDRNGAAPTLANTSASFTEDGPAVPVAPNPGTLNDADSANLMELVATLSNPLNGSAESLSANVAGTSITASWDAGSATLTLTGNDTLAHYQQVLQTVSYFNSSNTPDPSSRIITLMASDGVNHSNVATSTVTVSAVNDAPVNSVPPAQSTSEDTPLVFSTANGNAVSIADLDAGTSPVQVSLTATNGVLTLAGTGGLSFVSGDGNADASMSFSGTLADINAALDGLSFQPALNYTGAAGVQIATSDLGNTGSGGALSDSDAVAITVVPVNDPPVITSNGGGAAAAVNVAENTTAVTTVAATDVDLPAQTLSYAIVGGADQAQFTINASTGALGFVSAPNFEAPADSNADNVYDVTVQVADGNGGTDTQAVSVTVTNVNEAPSAANDNASGNEDSVIAGNVLVNDSDPENDALTASLVAGPANGSLVLNPDGSFSYTPNANWNGSDSFTYRASDGALDSTVTTVTLTVSPVNDAPTAANTTINATEDTAYAGTLPAASDVDGDPVSYALGSAAANGTAVVNSSGSFSYTPNADFNGNDGFTYTVADGNGGSNTYLVAISVAAVNDAPNAAGDVASGMQATVIVGNVLVNDSDPDGDPLTASLVAGPAQGLLVLNPDGSFSYTPNLSFSGNDSFTYLASDGSLYSGVVTATLTVNPIGNIPSAPLPPAKPPADLLSSSKRPVDPRSSSSPPVDPALVVTMPAAPPVSQSSGTLPSLPAQEESREGQAALDGGYETATTRLSQPIVNRYEEFTGPTQLDAWLTQLLDSTRVDDAGSTLDNLISPEVTIELTQDKNFKAAIYLEEAKISVLVLSAGAVWWGLRAGGLLASLLTSLPAWRALDVLPVLRDKEDEEVPWDPDEDPSRPPRQGRPETPLDEIAG